MTGAAILVALVVLVVPELLSGPRRAERPATTAAGEPPLRSYTLPLIEGTPGAVGQAAASGAVPQPAESLQADESPGPSSEAPAGGPEVAAAVGAAVHGSTTAHDAAAPHEAAPGHEGAVSHEKPGAHGAAVAREAPAARSVGAHSGSALASGAQAETVRSGAAAREATHPAPTPHSKATSGWSVQVGSFGSRGNADRLVSALKRKGYGAFVSETSSRGRKWYRVRVGPERDRAAAAAVARRLHAAGRGGEIIPPR